MYLFLAAALDYTGKKIRVVPRPKLGRDPLLLLLLLLLLLYETRFGLLLLLLLLVRLRRSIGDEACSCASRRAFDFRGGRVACGAERSGDK